MMTRSRFLGNKVGLAVLMLAWQAAVCSPHRAAHAQQPPPSSYSPVVITEEFETIRKRMEAAKPEIMERQMQLLAERYDLGDRPAKGVTMSRGKPVQEGVRVKLPAGVKSWQELAAMTPEDIREKGLWPKGFLPAAAPEPSRGRHGVPQAPHRRDQEAGRPRPDALRPGLRPAGALPARSFRRRST